MRNAPDPSWHQAREREIVTHVQTLLRDPKFVVDTSVGRRAASTLQQTSNTIDRATDLKRQMAQTRPDRELEARMPVGLTTDVQLAVNRWFVLQKIISTVRVSVVPPTKALLADRNPEPLGIVDGRHALGQLPPPLKNVPMTVILVSTSGWALEAHEIADRTAERVVILVEPNEAGGWSVHGPPEMRGVLDLLDPETADGKRDRVRQAIDAAKDELFSGSVAADKLSLSTQLPLGLVEEEVKAYAKNHFGLIAKRLDGRMLLFREGTAVTGKSIGGEGMTLMDRIRTLFNRKGDHEKKIAYLSERRAALAQQRDASHDEVETLEKKELALKTQFKATDSLSTRKRITAQLVQLRKDMDRRQQMLGVLNQQVNVVSTHLHNLELVQQGRSAQLPDTEEIATDAAAAEEMLAELQADSELADSVSASATAGMSDEEAALFAELTGEFGDTEKATANSSGTSSTGKAAIDVSAPTLRETTDRASAIDERRVDKPEAG